jgi:hypothetical protein
MFYRQKEDSMKKLVFESVQEAVEALDVSATHTKIKNAIGVACLTKQGAELADAERHAGEMLRFIETYGLKRELEAMLAESGRIDLTSPEGEKQLEPADYFAGIAIVARLLKASKVRATV